MHYKFFLFIQLISLNFISYCFPNDITHLERFFKKKFEELKYVAESIEEYNKIKERSFECLEKLSPIIKEQNKSFDEIFKHYKELSNKAEKNLVVAGRDLQIAYLSFLKIIEVYNIINKDRNELELLDVLGEKNHCNLKYHDEHSPILGILWDQMNAYIKFSERNPEFIRFGDAMYNKEDVPYTNMFSIPRINKKKLRYFASIELKEYLNTYFFEDVYNMSITFLKSEGDEFMEAGVIVRDTPLSEKYKNLTWTSSLYFDRFSKFKIILIDIIRNLIRFLSLNTLHVDRCYVPPEIVLLHELYHVMTLMPGEKCIQNSTTINYLNAVFELPTIVDQIVRQDKIYKLSKDIPISEIVEYPIKVLTNKNGYLNLGLIANTFRNLIKEEGSVLKALMSEKGKEFVSTYYLTSKLLDNEIIAK